MEGAHLHCRAYVAGHVQRELHDDAGDPELPDQRGLEGKPLVVFEAVDALASPVAVMAAGALHAAALPRPRVLCLERAAHTRHCYGSRTCSCFSQPAMCPLLMLHGPGAQPRAHTHGRRGCIGYLPGAQHATYAGLQAIS